MGGVSQLGQDTKASLILELLLHVSIYGQIVFLFQSFFPLLGNLRDFTLSQWSHVFFYDAIWSDE